MSFIETLRSVGGIKPCRCQSLVFTPETPVEHMDALRKKSAAKCPRCHGTGHILDLAPLLAKPPLLEHFVYLLCTEANKAGMNLGQMVGEMTRSFKDCRYDVSAEKTGHLHVVGPQRASNLVYEVARQLGGTAVVAIPQLPNITKWRAILDNEDQYQNHVTYRLSLPIPDNATVLFVTDRVDEHESAGMFNVASEAGMKSHLSYLLALVSDRDYVNSQGWEVISLHQEKP